jgi:hypothetical protein
MMSNLSTMKPQESDSLQTERRSGIDTSAEMLDEAEFGPCVYVTEFRNALRKTKRVSVTVLQGDFVQFEFENGHVGDLADNSAEYTFRLSTPGGQAMVLNGEEVENVALTIVGDWEMNELVNAMREFVALAAERPELVGPPHR